MPRPQRIIAVDRLRGLVMILMTLDHADAAFSAGHLMTDSANFAFGQPLPGGQFFTRWLTHLCAPTFLFLAGVSVVLSSARSAEKGTTPGAIDRHLALRGLLIALLDPLVMTFAFGVWWLAPGGGHPVLLQVLYAIGIGLLLSPLLRRLPSLALLVISAAILVANEWVFPANLMNWTTQPPTAPPLWLSLTLTGGIHPRLIENYGLMVMYPALPWVAVMMFGIVFGRVLQNHGARRAARVALLFGLSGLALFALVRGLNSWGNTGLPRTDGSWQQWLRCSKYPPGISYLAMELGLMGLILAALLTRDAARSATPDDAPPSEPVRDPVSILGKTALLYYLLHIPLLNAASLLIWWARHPGDSPSAFAPEFGLGTTWLAAALGVVALYPVCWWYGRYKRRHKNLLTRYL